MNYKNNWKDTREKFINWWEHRNTGRPLMIVVAKKNEFVLKLGTIPLYTVPGLRMM